MILDEPTADLDLESAGLVADAIEQLRGRCTLLLYRASAGARLTDPDRIIAIEGGRAVEPREAAV